MFGRPPYRLFDWRINLYDLRKVQEKANRLTGKQRFWRGLVCLVCGVTVLVVPYLFKLYGHEMRRSSDSGEPYTWLFFVVLFAVIFTLGGVWTLVSLGFKYFRGSAKESLSKPGSSDAWHERFVVQTLFFAGVLIATLVYIDYLIS